MPENQDKKKYINDIKGNGVLLSLEFIKTQPKMITHAGSFYIFNGKFYERQSKTMLNKKIFQFFKDNGILSAWQSRKAKEMVEAMEVCNTIKEVENIDDYSNLISLSNTIYNLDTGVLIPHSDEYYFTYVIDIKYDAEQTKHPEFTKFLNGIFKLNSNATDIDTIDLVLYIMAYLLYPKIKINMLFIFLGGGANGKTILINLIKKFFAKQYITSLSLGVISNEDSIFRNSLEYSKLNITVEQKVSKKIESEELKKVTEGSLIPIRKLYNEPIDIEPKTKILLAAQDFPYFNDTSDGIMRRLMLIEFKNKFIPLHEYVKEKNPEIRHIYLGRNEDELLASLCAEKSAILNTLLFYLIKLKDKMNWQLPETVNTENTMIEYKEGADVFGTWLNNNYILDDDTWGTARHPSLTDILQEFRVYYDINYPGSRSKLSARGVGKKIKQIFRIDGMRVNRNNQRLTIYSITKKNHNEEYFNDTEIKQSIPAPESKAVNGNFQDSFPDIDFSS